MENIQEGGNDINNLIEEAKTLGLWQAEYESMGEKGLSALLPKHIEMAKKRIEMAKKLNEEKKKLIELEKKFPTFHDLAKKASKHQNETQSSPNTYTGHKKASYQKMSFPAVQLNESFWNFRPSYNFPESIDSETEVQMSVLNLMENIIKALELGEYLTAKPDIQIMDTIPDILIISKLNKQIVGTIEVKKSPRTTEEENRIFASNTEVAGEAFEQIQLVRLQRATKEGLAVGLVTTLDICQLISTKNIDGAPLDMEKAKKSLGKRQTPNLKLTPDKPKNIAHSSGASNRNARKKQKRDEYTQRVKNASSKSKYGRVTARIKETNTPREYFATNTLKLGNVEDNRKLFELLASYVLLCVRTLEEGNDPLDVTKECKLLVRKVAVNSKKISFTEIKLSKGSINFDATPCSSDNTFYAIRQLAYGESGASCFACSNSYAPCVIKFFRKDIPFNDAKDEAKKWQDVYKGYFDFVKAYECACSVLIMPFLRVPSDYTERAKLIACDDSAEEKSLLYKALEHFAGKGYIHEEPFWHHVGVFEVSSQAVKEEAGCNPRRRQKVEIKTCKIAIFCDLAHAKKEKDDTKRNVWINDTYRQMKERIGAAPDYQRLVN